MKKFVALLLISVMLFSCLFVLAEVVVGTVQPPEAEFVNLTPTFQGLISAVITVFLLPWIKARTTSTQQATLLVTIKMLVYGAEQLWLTGKIQDKLKYVIEQLEAKKIKIDLAVIEATVKIMNEEQKRNQPPVLVELPYNPESAAPVV